MSGMCCQNNYTIKSGEADIDLFKRKTIKVRLEEEQNITNSKPKNQKDILEKHLKDNSFKQTSLQNSRVENKNRLDKLKEIFESNASPLLNLTVINSNVNSIQKGDLLTINCLGLVGSESKDGYVFFGFSDEISDERIDFQLPIQNTDLESNK